MRQETEKLKLNNGVYCTSGGYFVLCEAFVDVFFEHTPEKVVLVIDTQDREGSVGVRLDRDNLLDATLYWKPLRREVRIPKDAIETDYNGRLDTHDYLQVILHEFMDKGHDVVYATLYEVE